MTHRFYGELARWWPLVSAVEDYEEEAGFVATLLRRAARPVRDVLELGSGGGHNAWHLGRSFEMTLVDLSPEMIEVSIEANPTMVHHVGDMRDVRLDRDFDAVFVHDAVDYMTSTADLGAAMATAFAHIRPGGVAVFVPDSVTETFEPSTDHGGHDDLDSGRGVRYLEWTWDPDPSDHHVTTEYSFLLREAAGSVRSVHESHLIGVFPTETWTELLTDAGFEPEVVTEVTTEDRTPRTCFVAHRP